MAQERKNHKVALKAFHVQEGLSIVLCKLIIDSVPKELIVKLEGEDTFVDKVVPRDLIATATESATPNTILESMELVKLCNASLVFNTNKKLSLQFKQHANHIEDLLHVHNIKTSEMECMVK